MEALYRARDPAPLLALASAAEEGGLSGDAVILAGTSGLLVELISTDGFCAMQVRLETEPLAPAGFAGLRPLRCPARALARAIRAAALPPQWPMDVAVDQGGAAERDPVLAVRGRGTHAILRAGTVGYSERPPIDMDDVGRAPAGAWIDPEPLLRAARSILRTPVETVLADADGLAWALDDEVFLLCPWADPGGGGARLPPPAGGRAAGPGSYSARHVATPLAALDAAWIERGRFLGAAEEGPFCVDLRGRGGEWRLAFAVSPIVEVDSGGDSPDGTGV